MTHDPSEKPQQYWILNEQIKFGETISSNPKDHACLVALFRIPIRGESLRLVDHASYQSAIERVKELREAVTALQVELNSLRTVNEILQSERLAKTKESP